MEEEKLKIAVKVQNTRLNLKGWTERDGGVGIIFSLCILRNNQIAETKDWVGSVQFTVVATYFFFIDQKESTASSFLCFFFSCVAAFSRSNSYKEL